MTNSFNNLINTGASGILDTTFNNIETAIGLAQDKMTISEIGNAVASGVANANPISNELQFQMQANAEKENQENDTLQQTLQWAEDQQAKEWERENAIRKETQEREDNAWQRAIKDMQAAGVNPNLVNASAAASGGGITSATGLNMSQYETTANKLLEEWKTMVEQDFERNENRKDRYNNIMKGLLNLAGLGIFAGKKK